MDARARLLLLMVMPCVLGRGVNAGVVIDAEPNDSLVTATPTGLTNAVAVLVPDAAIGNGALGAADRDLFAFHLKKPPRKRFWSR